MAVRKLKAAQAPTMGFLIDSLHEVREQKRILNAQLKELDERYDGLQNQLLQMMDAEGVAKSTGRLATASVTESTQFNIENWDAFCEFMRKGKHFHLVQRRVSAPAVREMCGLKGPVPGLAPFTKREINLRNL